MKKENTASRLREIMETRNLRQVDILNMTRPYCQKYNVKMNKSDISQYCSGKTEPNHNKLFVLGRALNVNEAWLMGYDVPMERISHENELPKILSYYHMLNALGKETATEQVRLLTLDEKYTKPDNIISMIKEPESDYLAPNAAHEFTNASPDDKQYDEDIMNNDNF